MSDSQKTDLEMGHGSGTWLSRKDVAARVNPHLLSLLKVEPQHETRVLPAHELLSASRLDVMAKHIYASEAIQGGPSEWGTHVYREHLRVWSGFREGDGSGKSSFEDYRNAFDSLLTDVSTNGFDEGRGLLPVGEGDVIIDGSHRLAAALALDTPLQVVRFDTQARKYDYEFFLGRGLDTDVLDAMALEYCRLDPEVRVAVLFPVASGHDDEVIGILRDAGEIVYRKDVTFARTGRANLVRLLYRNEAWLGAGLSPTPGLLAHVNNRFVEGKPVRFIFFHGADEETNREVKRGIRALYDLGNNSAHINDTHEQTVTISESILNTNGIHFINHARPAVVRRFGQLFRDSKAWIRHEGLDPQRFCIDGSGVLAAYGLRDVADLDYLYLGTALPEGSPALFSCHNEEAYRYDAPLGNLVTDPRNHFYWEGMKFLALHHVRALKRRRAKSKDLGDVYRIDVLEGRVGISGRCLRIYYTLLDGMNRQRFSALGWMKRLTPAPLLPLAKGLRNLPQRIRDSLGPVEQSAIYRGFELHYSRGTSLLEWIRRGRVYEPRLSQRIVRTLRRTDPAMFLDIGANIGLITLNILAEAPWTRVVAFEPGPHQAALIERTVAANHLGDRVTVVRSALGRESGRADFSVHRSRHASGDGFYDTGRAGRVNPIQVRVTTLDGWWKAAGEPPIDAIKIDTEGAELWVLEGGDSLIHRCHPLIVFELHPDNLRVYPYEATDVVDFLEARGYAIETVSGTPVTRTSIKQNLETANDYVALYKS